MSASSSNRNLLAMVDRKLPLSNFGCGSFLWTWSTPLIIGTIALLYELEFG